MSVPVFHALDVTRKEIRLVRLAPSSDIDEQASCTLEIKSLQESPVYEALSYAWGDPRVLRSIKLQGLEWYLTTNLEAALRYLRDPVDEKIFWIDAICINQGDSAERTSQVQMMGDIYSQAEHVRVWLGRSAGDSDTAFDVLRALGEGENLLDVQASGQLLDETHLRAVSRLCKRPWWQRVWVQQEFVLAQQAFLHCGTKSTDVECLARLGFGPRSLLWEDLEDAARRFGPDAVGEFIEIIDQSWVLLQATRNLHDRFLGESDADRLDVFVALLGMGRRLCVRFPHDRIYGFLGMAPEILRRRIEPNYIAPVAQVYRHFAYSFMKTSRSLAILSQTELVGATQTDQTLRSFRPRASRTASLPSWVPDWSDSSLETHPRIPRYRLFSACGNEELSLGLVEDSILRLRGLPFDRVHRINNVRSYKSFQRTCGMTSKRREQARYVGGGTMFNAYWRTLVTDVIKDADLTERRCVAEDYQRLIEASRHENKNFVSFKDHKTWGRRLADRETHMFFVSDREYIGMCAPTTMPGDIVYIVAGGAQPLILRPVPTAARPNTFTFVGQCYVHGIMDGEAVETRKHDRMTWKDRIRLRIYRGRGPDRTLPRQDYRDIFIE
jgi:hypothetical protein